MKTALSLLCIIFLTTLNQSAFTQESTQKSLDRKIEEFERMMQEMDTHLQALLKERALQKAGISGQNQKIEELSTRLETLEVEDTIQDDAWYNRFTLGGYGEVHANISEGQGSDQVDIHRLVLYLGYDFNDWIKLHTETEIEHGYVSSGSGGELALEQAYVDFLLMDQINVRAGRILTPLGIVNRKHEPPSFNGVERPSFDRYIIPTTWSSDGVGIFGSLMPSLKYEAYVVGGLDGSQFNGTNGIRGGRLKERPSLNDLAFAGRLDYFPLLNSDVPYGQSLRLGLSAYAGGIDNGNRGRNPGVDGDIQIYSADFEYTISDFDFRGVFAFENIGGAETIGNNTADEIVGWYMEAAYHFWPDAWKNGLLENSDAVVFVRYDDIDTQAGMPSGVTADPAGDRSEWTFGLNFYPVPNFVVKTDYQLRDDDTTSGLDNAFNLGIGWQF